METGKGDSKSKLITCSQSDERKCGRPYLPPEIIFNILIRLPVEFLYYIARYVCRSWNEMISSPIFIKAHLLQSNPGLLIQRGKEPYPVQLFETKDGKIKASPKHFQPSGFLLASSGGLLLISDLESGKDLYLVNNVTLKVMNIPRPPVSDGPSLFQCSMSFIPSTGEIKVIWVHPDLKGMNWYVITVGIDTSWRVMDRAIVEQSEPEMLLRSYSVSGVIYWAIFMPDGGSTVFATDLRDETFHMVQISEKMAEEPGIYQLATSIDHLCAVKFYKLKPFIDLYILKDFCHSKWEHLHKVNMTLDLVRIQNYLYRTVVWLDDIQTLTFEIGETSETSFMVAYDLKTGKSKDITKTGLINYFAAMHTTSLVSW